MLSLAVLNPFSRVLSFQRHESLVFYYQNGKYAQILTAFIMCSIYYIPAGQTYSLIIGIGT
ncbi:hypothetical protein BDR07DRAFT_1422654 [Suillus spraguei]|nr:hypothetical protein BDR07DRAFT_1422654 [Suillus spraguei]